MIPKSARLPSDAFREQGYRRVGTRFFSLKSKNNGLSVNRVGVIVGISVDKRAVRRNLLERRAKAGLLKLPKLPGAGMDIIVTIFPGAGKLPREEFRKELQFLFEKIK